MEVYGHNDYGNNDSTKFVHGYYVTFIVDKKIFFKILSKSLLKHRERSRLDRLKGGNT